MKLLHVISPSGEKLFSGTKRDCKMFIRKNRIKKYTLKGQFIEKVVHTTFTSEPEPDTTYAESWKTGKSETWFNEIFNDE